MVETLVLVVGKRADQQLVDSSKDGAEMDEKDERANNLSVRGTAAAAASSCSSSSFVALHPAAVAEEMKNNNIAAAAASAAVSASSSDRDAHGRDSDGDVQMEEQITPKEANNQQGEKEENKQQQVRTLHPSIRISQLQ